MIKKYLLELATDKKQGAGSRMLKAVLFVLSVFYGAIIRGLILWYRLIPCRLSCKVVSVGNITLGGTGKTPLVEFIARYLKGQGSHVAIITRGYKKPKTGSALPRSSYASMGDEAAMLAHNLRDVSVIVDADRVAGSLRAIREHKADTVIFDDGFQQWRIAKDLEIVVVDAAVFFGNRQMIPRGILREPLSSLQRADIFVLNNTQVIADTAALHDWLARVNNRAMVVEAVAHPIGFYRIDNPDELLAPGIFKGKTVVLVSGIGNPDHFEKLIGTMGIQSALSVRYQDHYRYSPRDWQLLCARSKEKNIDTIITTQKDAVRFLSLYQKNPLCALYALRIELKIVKNEQRFLNRLLRLYSL
ncbi:MAG: tetraacyldisaccharide 4'-kinase [Candidatus Omnitrophota bacterium]|jgi:tetraacyldisaccharide 4'-kinase